MDYFLNLVFLGNTLFSYVIAADVFLASWIVLFLAREIVSYRLGLSTKETNSKIFELIVLLISKINWVIYFVLSLNAAFLILNVHFWAGRVLALATILVLATYFTVVTREITNLWLNSFVKSSVDIDNDPRSKSMVHLIGLLTQTMIWIICFILGMQILDINISALIGTLGIGGIAIAFALQSILSDVFASFSIYFDRPFAVGDFIQIGLDNGVVEQIGVKSTRVKTLQGQILIVPNKELTSMRVQNFSHLKTRRAKIKFSVDTATTNSNLKKITKTLEKIIKNQKKCKFERCNLEGYGNFGLDFEAIYYIESSDYILYMSIQEEIVLDLKAFLEQENIKVVLPSNLKILESYQIS